MFCGRVFKSYQLSVIKAKHEYVTLSSPFYTIYPSPPNPFETKSQFETLVTNRRAFRCRSLCMIQKGPGCIISSKPTTVESENSRLRQLLVRSPHEKSHQRTQDLTCNHSHENFRSHRRRPRVGSWFQQRPVLPGSWELL